MAKERKFGATCHAGGMKLEIVSPHQEWLDWALDTLYAAAKDKRLAYRHYGNITPSGSVECPHYHWGFAPSVIDQHIREKH